MNGFVLFAIRYKPHINYDRPANSIDLVGTVQICSLCPECPDHKLNSAGDYGDPIIHDYKIET